MVGLDVIYSAFIDSCGISTDSRNCPTGAMFVALKGDRFDGNKYIKEVLNNGAKYAISSSIDFEHLDNVFVVDDTLKTLQDLAQFHRRQLNLPILSITGTNGKTTSKELINAVLSEQYKTRATAGNFNNHIGVPLTLLSFDKSTEIGIVEMGANHIGEIELLCSIAEPSFSIITNVGKAHLEGFGSFEGVKQAKGEMYNYARKNDGLIFINNSNTHLNDMAAQNDKRIDFGGLNSEVTGKICKSSPLISVEWHQKSTNKDYLIQTNLIGTYNLENILAAITIGLHFDVPPIKINHAIENYTPSNNRSQFIKTKSNQIIMDAYNANPSSMKVALENFNQVEAATKCVLLGGMKELGTDSEDEHRNLIQLIKSFNFDKAILIGEEFNPFREEFDCFANSEEVIKYLQQNPVSNAHILIKGSRSNKLEDILPFL